MQDLLGRVSNLRGGAGKVDRDASTYWTSPWAWRDEDGLYIGHNKQGWLYHELPINPLLWEDPVVRLEVGAPLEGLLAELGSLDKDNSMGIKLLAAGRELHLVSVGWEAPGDVPAGTEEDLREYQKACLDFLIPQRALLLGVKLKSSNAVVASAKKGLKGLVEQLKETGVKALGEDIPDRAVFDEDRDRVQRVLRRYGAYAPSRATLDQLESWFNLGRGVDVLIQVSDDRLYIDDFDQIQFSAVRRFNNPVMHAPDAQWVLDAINSANGPNVVSVRAVLQSPQVAQNRARSAQRRIRSQMEEEMATGDIERIEDTVAFEQAREVEQYISSAREPLLSEVSIVMAARTSPDQTETYMDELRSGYGIEMTPLVMRQLEALDECLPCSSKRTNPFLQDVSLSMLAYCGIQGWSNLGDGKGVLMGLTDPDYTPCYLDPKGAPAANLPPAMGIFGDPGSGKTYLCQHLATQAVLAGEQVIFINPKGFDTLESFAEIVDGTVVRMSELEQTPGVFDPFRFAKPEMAAEIAANYILSVLGSTGVAGGGFDAAQELALSSGLKQGAYAGARCVTDALGYVEDKGVVELVRQQIMSSALFGIGIAPEPGEQYQAQRGLTLIEFDRKLDFPERGKAANTYTRSERIALAAVRLVTRASLEILVGSGGGVLVLDEAWTFLSSSEGLAALQQIGREGRSLNLLPILATQRVDDLIKEGVDMEGYMSRVMVMKLNEERDARAALKLCGLSATDQRIAWLRQAGPRPGSNGAPGRPAMGLHRDLRNRHAAVYVGPVPPAAHTAFTTNPEERKQREARRLVRTVQEEAVGTSTQDHTDEQTNPETQNPD